MHERRTPGAHLFRYGVYMWLVDLDELAASTAACGPAASTAGR